MCSCFKPNGCPYYVSQQMLYLFDDIEIKHVTCFLLITSRYGCFHHDAALIRALIRQRRCDAISASKFVIEHIIITKCLCAVEKGCANSRCVTSGAAPISIQSPLREYLLCYKRIDYF
ncbi:hypothetical protein TNCV_4376141 [Trichonephila clavipes]|nr:hypothetical protein TNCV_4376141 [Trichonephila clavipes]